MTYVPQRQVAFGADVSTDWPVTLEEDDDEGHGDAKDDGAAVPLGDQNGFEQHVGCGCPGRCRGGGFPKE